VADRINGILAFLPVPIVLWLFTRQPVGAWASLAVGVALMATHRLYARPFALARADRRCLWCGAPAGEGPRVEVEEPLGRTAWRACRSDHAIRLSRTLGWAVEHRAFLSVGILGALSLFLAGAGLAATGRVPGLRAADPIALFRALVAVVVLPFGWLALRGDPAKAGGRLAFPVHIQALIGTNWVLWLFRLVGIWWLAAGLGHLALRLAGASPP
jgi:hypothetical protein